MERQALSVTSFGGINKLHTRELGQMSEGKNFFTRNGVLVTREGSTTLTSTPFSGAIRSIHSAVRVGYPPYLIVEDSTGLWRYNNVSWRRISTDIGTYPYSGLAYYNNLILVNGPKKYAYDLTSDTLTPLQNVSGSYVPDMELITSFKDILFGWGPHMPISDVVHFNGPDPEANLPRSKDSWPAAFNIRVPDDTGSPVVACVPAGAQLLIFTYYKYYVLYGDNEDNFTLAPGGAVGVFSERTAAQVGDYVIWLDVDNTGYKRVYAYSGTQPYVISQPVEELLNTLPSSVFSNAKAYGLGSRFWLILPQTNKTQAFIFDTEEKQWFIYEFPYVITCATMHNDEVYFGTQDGKIVRLDETLSTDNGTAITTEFVIGPIQIPDARKFKVKTLWVNADPKSSFTLQAYISADGSPEAGPYTASFSVGGEITQQVKIRGELGGHRGRVVYLRVTSQDKIDELQGFSLTVMPLGVK